MLFVGSSMKTRIVKSGDSLALRIPKAIAEAAQLTEGAEVDVRVRNGTVVIDTLREPEYTLEELVAKIIPENRHSETDTGRPVGNEVWEGAFADRIRATLASGE